MTTQDQLKDDLDFIASTVRRNDRSGGLPALYVFWALAIAIGFTLADFAPRIVGWYWLLVGIGGGIGSMLYADRVSRQRGISNSEEGKRWGLHFMVGGFGWLATALPMMTGKLSPEAGAPWFLFTTGLVYALAGVHLDRPMLWSGLLALAGFMVMQLVAVPYVWTTTGLLMALCLGTAAVLTARK